MRRSGRKVFGRGPVLRTAGLLLAVLVALPLHAAQIHVSTEEYPPYNVRGSDGRPTGVYMDQLKIIFERTGISYDATILPWARAIALAETTNSYCVAAAARTPERENRFKWISPIHTDRNVLVARKDAHLDVKTIKDAKRYSVGTQRDDYTETLLRSLHFTRIDLSADFETTHTRLLSGRIDMMPMSESALSKLSGEDLVEVAVLAHQSLGMACNKSVPDSLIRKMQSALDALIADGTQRRIYERYGLVIRN
ncbi:amino acid ABC transporter substrate-binding protein [Agrobacterium rubi]|uniref:Amino acid ABC transporter substrate-binding protein n=1 Tax=Agrobacterium rubi TaxID=28099 RepID=A0AAE7UNH2_9HYPH|nr:amino acid ABC transporter substrate-binding protein [Agrobacterium rubi]NTF02883.1 amino acid ABC transporter substrate-binding protein [Agrobacterium rubi]NTF37127.1 amino acid ABC transporter substrate-binding protein [Agrobacterium rubi]OCJ55288.1 ABC transporter substrate-binding protein [Agrobacterium rubi]QTF99558.1 amino acid ABC transporter substrate-binding protein [Agrobacterium rubi]